MSERSEEAIIKDDIKQLHSLGYAQELSRRMKTFSNFAVSFSIICILSGGINSIAQGISGAGGGALGIGWIVGCLISLVFALALAQISSAFPTAGGLYHWGSILGGVGWGWVTAWLNLIGLVTVLGAINVGTYLFFIGAFGGLLGIENTPLTQAIFLAIITALQAFINHRGIQLTSRLTDFSGYLIFFGAIAIGLAFFAFAPSWDFSRLWTFKNFSGDAGGGVWPETNSLIYIFALGLLMPIYTITGYDASAHTAEETVNAANAVPRGMVSSVVWSMLFGLFFLAGFTVAIPNMDEAAKQGWNVFFWTSDTVLPPIIKYILYLIIFVAQFLCGLATVTSASRMIYAFSRDEGLPASSLLKKVSPSFRTPVAAIWLSAILAWLFTIYTPVYSTVVSVTVIFLFLSFAVPIFFAMRAHGGKWSQMGPWSLGGLFKPIAALSLVAMALIFIIGVQPPNDKALLITLGFLVLTGLVWFLIERRRFKGPPQGTMIQSRMKQIEEAERAVGETVMMN
jgi:amino acid transporter